MKKNSFFLIFLFVFIFVQSGFGEEIKIYGNEARPPKIWQENNEPKGILVDILKYAEPQMGSVLKIELYPMARSIKNAEGKLGGVIGFSKNEERLKIFDFSDPVYYDEVVLVVKKGREFDFKKIDDLAGKTVVFQRGASYGPEFEEAKRILKPHESNSPVNSLQFLAAGRADAAIVSPGKEALNYILKDPELQKVKNDFVVLEKPLTKDPNYLAFHKDLKMTNFLTKFNTVIKTGLENGDIKKIAEKYSK